MPCLYFFDMPHMRRKGLLIWKSRIKKSNRKYKNLKQTKTFRSFQAFRFKCSAKLKIQKPQKWAFFLIKPYRKNKVFFFCFRSFFRFLDFEFHILPDVEVKENFPGFLSFWVETWKAQNFAFFLIKPHPKVIVSFF